MPTMSIHTVDCDRCGQVSLVAPGGPAVDDQAAVCATCLVAFYVKCAACSTHTRHPWPTADGQVCESCADSDFTYCEHCDKYSDDTVTLTTGADVCMRCAEEHYEQCDDCSRYTDSTITVNNGDGVCYRCVRASYWTCSRCGDVIPDSEECEDCPCECGDCAECEDDRDSSGIHCYNYKPIPEFKGDGPLYLGLELEVSTPRYDLAECADTAGVHLRGLGYLKEDSSIGVGFEIVTHPMSFEWAMENFPWRMLPDLADEGCRATDWTGMHVHISRAGFDSPSHVHRWMKLLHRNASRVTCVARRVSDEWAAFNSTDRRLVKDYAKGAKGSERYSAINTLNDDTFELRVFASSLEPQQVKAALGLAAASVEYTRSLTVADIAQRGGWEWKSFVVWLDAHPEYVNLSRELEYLSCVS